MDKIQVVIVEDEAIVSMGLRHELESFGYSVPAEFRTGEEAVEAVPHLLPDLVLMDIRLGEGMDGIETGALIQGQFNVPVVYLTAYAVPDMLNRRELTEIFDCLTKPVASEHLRLAIDTAILRYGSEGNPNS